MITDRQRVEAGIIPALIYGIVKPLEDVQETDEEKARHRQIVVASLQATADAGADLMTKHAAKIFRRTERLYLTITKAIEGTSNAQAMVAVYYLLESLLREERLAIYEDTDFGQALQTYMAAIDHLFAEEKLDAAAQKRARKMREILEREGYFR